MLGNILTPESPSEFKVTGRVVRPKMVLLAVPDAIVIVLAPAKVLSVILKLWVL